MLSPAQFVPTPTQASRSASHPHISAPSLTPASFTVPQASPTPTHGFIRSLVTNKKGKLAVKRTSLRQLRKKK